MKILHIITGLNNGGAEGALYRLAAFDLLHGGHEHIVVSLMDRGIYAERLEHVGATVYCLDMPRGRVTVGGLVRLYRIIKRIKPKVIQTWMYHADLIGGIIARLAGIRAIAWGIRHANMDPSKNDRVTLWIAMICAKISPFIPAKIVSCSLKATETHQAFGYQREKFTYIPNGYALDKFSPNYSDRMALRHKLNIPANAFVLGMVARFHEQKDHANLFGALALLKNISIEKNFICILVGEAVELSNDHLMVQIQEAGLLDRIILLGARNDIPSIMNALDLHVLSSVGEAFPNVLAEAMACGTPCVTTDVGDAALIVRKCGWVVPPQDSRSLFNAICAAQLLHCDKPAWERLQLACRQHITMNFELSRMATSYRSVWQQCIDLTK